MPNNTLSLCEAASKGDCNTISLLLLEEGVDIDGVDVHGKTPLLAAVSMAYPEAAKLLVSKGANVNVSCLGRNTPLHFAITHCQNELIEHLLMKGADPNAVNSQQQTPLHYAMSPYHGFDTEDEQLRVIEMLLAKGADVNVADMEGRTAVHKAVRQSEQLLDLILKSRDADVNAVAECGDRPLHVATNYNKPAVVSKLIAKGAEVDTADDSYTPLHEAAAEGYLEVMALLLKSGASVDRVEDDESCNPLHCAAINGSVEAVELLLAHGANIDTYDGRGRTPYLLAANTEVAKALNAHGAGHMIASQNKSRKFLPSSSSESESSDSD